MGVALAQPDGFEPRRFRARQLTMGRAGHVAYVGKLTVELGDVPAADRAEQLIKAPDYADEGPSEWVAEPSADGLPTRFHAQDARIPLSVSVGEPVVFRQHTISLLSTARPALPWAPLSAKLRVETVPCTDEQFEPLREERVVPIAAGQRGDLDRVARHERGSL